MDGNGFSFVSRDICRVADDGADESAVEGLFTIVCSFAIVFLLPGSPDQPRPLVGRGVTKFTGPELEALRTQLIQDNMYNPTGVRGSRIPLRVVWKTVCEYRRWPHFISTFAVFSTWSPLITYTPSIIL